MNHIKIKKIDCGYSGKTIPLKGEAALWEWSPQIANISGGDKKEDIYVKVKLLSHVRLFVTPRTVAYQVPPSMGFSRQEYWSGLPFPSPGDLPDPEIEVRVLQASCGEPEVSTLHLGGGLSSTEEFKDVVRNIL